MSSILDALKGCEFASDFSTTQGLHDLFLLVYKKKKKLFLFYICWEMKFEIEIYYCVGNNFYFSKKWYLEFCFLAPQIYLLIH